MKKILNIIVCLFTGVAFALIVYCFIAIFSTHWSIQQWSNELKYAGGIACFGSFVFGAFISLNED